MDRSSSTSDTQAHREPTTPSFHRHKGLSISYGTTRAKATQAVHASATEIAVVAAQAALDKQGTDLLVLDVEEICNFASVFVLATASNPRLLGTIVDSVEEQVRAAFGDSPIAIEGRGDTNWVVLDYGGTIIHVFSTESREFYQLERLWADGRTIEIVDPHTEATS
ncbi:MAG: ribosome silencing factor [Ferrimicrobium sp.]